MPSTVEPIVLVADLEAYQSGDPQGLIDAATAAVRRYCGWHITPTRTETLTLTSDGSSTLMLPSLCVFDVAAVTYGETLLAPDDYAWTPYGVIALSRSLLYGCAPLWTTVLPQTVSVTLTHGFAAAPDVEGVILSMVARAQVSPSGVIRSQVGQVGFTYSQTGTGQAGGIAMLPNEISTLDLFRLAPRP